jgi:hypothetical protein
VHPVVSSAFAVASYMVTAGQFAITVMLNPHNADSYVKVVSLSRLLHSWTTRKRPNK